MPLANICAGAVALGLCAPALGAAQHSAAQQPNIIVIYSDDQGMGDVGYHGIDDIKTPNIDKLAAGGIHFPQAYVSASVCGPSRAGLMTGVHQQRFGVYGNFKDNQIPHDQPLMTEMMQGFGYQTAMIGKWHMGNPTGTPNERGADFFYGFRTASHNYYKSDAEEGGRPYLSPIYRNEIAEPPIQEKNGYLTELLTEEAVGFIDRNADKPFFLHLAHFATHHPWTAPQSYIDRVQDLDASDDRKVFAAMALAMDDGIGEVVDALKRHGVYDNTLIFFMSDNGSPARPAELARGEYITSSPGIYNGSKGDTYEGGIRVPFLMHWPAGLPAGGVYEHPVMNLDIMPTINALLGGDEGGAGPVKFDGVDLMPYLLGAKPADQRPHELMHWRRDDDYAIRDGDWKLTWNDNHGPQTIRLYNIADDPGEWHDLAYKMPEKTQQLKDRFDAWEAELPINKLGPKPTNRNLDYHKGHRVNVMKFNNAMADQ
ncbi:sulfatase family protein [Ferrimonas pelagia]|uniref:Sulfatase N-terminal domain-containing protein n=1 Tax=Ferrimonas pelagia TaxID=1177826 RepID=A0ABP9FC91_9GAMM